jgi:hypothetical protein
MTSSTWFARGTGGRSWRRGRRWSSTSSTACPGRSTTAASSVRNSRALWLFATSRTRISSSPLHSGTALQQAGHTQAVHHYIQVLLCNKPDMRPAVHHYIQVLLCNRPDTHQQFTITFRYCFATSRTRTQQSLPLSDPTFAKSRHKSAVSFLIFIFCFATDRTLAFKAAGIYFATSLTHRITIVFIHT